MDHILSYIFSFPNVLIYAVFGAIFGAVGGGLGMLIAKKVKSKTLSQVIWVGFLMFSIQLSTISVKSLQRDVMASKIVNGLVENKLFSVIIKLYPEAKKEIKGQYKDLLKSKISNDQMFYESQKITAALSNKYFQQSVLNASNNSIYELIKNDVKTLNSFKSKPKLCLAYFLGNGGFSENDLSQDLIDLVTSIKADIIESSVTNPSVLAKKDVNVNEIRDLVTSAYKARGYDIKYFQKLDQINLLEPKEACEVAIKLNSALEYLGSEKGTYVFKAMMLLSRQ
jgi:hypothetical protein